MPVNRRDWYHQREVAEHLEVSRPVVKQWTEEGRLAVDVVPVGDGKPSYRYPKTFIKALPKGVKPPRLLTPGEPPSDLRALDAVIEERAQERARASLDVLAEHFRSVEMGRYRMAIGKMAEAIMVFADDPKMTVEHVLREAALHVEEQRNSDGKDVSH
jgi:hypothetical protein